MRFSVVFRYRKSYGAVLCCDISYGAVRCGFQKSGILRCGSVRFSDIVNPTVRFGAVIYLTCGSSRFPVERFFLQCSSTLRRENRTTPFFLHGAPHEQTVQNRGFVRFSRIFSGHERNRCFSAVSLRFTVFINRTNPRVRMVFCRFFYLYGKVISNRS